MKKNFLIGFMVAIAAVVFTSATLVNLGSGVHSRKFRYGSAPPFYSASDTLVSTLGNSTKDTFDAAITGNRASITWHWDFVKVAGTAGGKIYIWRSANSGTSYKLIDSINISTATSQTLQYTMTGNLGTNYMAVVTDTGSQTSSCIGWLLPR